MDDARAETALALIPKAAKAVEMSEIEFLNVAFEIAYDPYTEFLYETWSPNEDGCPHLADDTGSEATMSKRSRARPAKPDAREKRD